MNFSTFAKQKFGENKNKTTFLGSVSGKSGEDLVAAQSQAAQNAQIRIQESNKEPFWSAWFRDTGNVDQVVDSTTGRVISVEKPAAIGGTVKGALKSTAAQAVNLAGLGANALNVGVDTAENYDSDYAKRQVERIQQSLQTGRLSDGRAVTDTMRKTLQDSLAKYQEQAKDVPTGTYEQRHPILDAAQEKLYNTADTLQASADQDIAQAKEGLGSVGQFAVDAGVAGTQLAGDALIAALTGGSALPVIFARSAGGAAQEARQSGADLGNQIAYGLGSGALSVATEKISNVAAPFRKIFGSGVADNLAGKLVERFGENAAVQTMQRLSQTAAGKLAASALGEGSEEFVEDVFQPVLQRATYDKSASFDLSQALYDAAIGATLGGIGGAVDVAQNRTRNTPVSAQEAAGTAQINPATADISTSQMPAQPVTTGIMEREAQRLYNPQENISLTERVRRSIPQIQGMNPVSNITGNEIGGTGKLVDRLVNFVNSIGNKVNRPGFGDVLFSRGRIKSSMLGHGMGSAKINTFAAVPAVIQDGQQIDYQQNWKGRGYDTYTFAAPITYKGKTTYLGVIVTKDSSDGKYYVHEVVDENGNILFENKEIPASTSVNAGSPAKTASDGRATLSGTVDTVADSASAVSIPQEERTVNGVVEENADGLGAADAGSLNTDYDRLQAQSSRFYSEGANAARPVDVPMQDFSGRNISKSASTVMGAKAIPDDVVPLIEQLVSQGDLSYTINTDQQAKVRAVSTIRKNGFDGAMERFRSAVNRGEVSKDIVSLGQALINNAANAKDGNAVAELMSLYQKISTRTGQAMQAMSIFRKLSPTSQLYGIQKTVEDLNDALNNAKNRRWVKNSDNIPVDQWMTKTGELLAQQLAKISNPSAKNPKTVSQTILSDLRKFAKNYLPENQTSFGSKRTDVDRIVDLFNNYDNYQKAFESAKKTIAKEYGENAQVQSVLDEWIKSTLDYNAMFNAQVSKETGFNIQVDPVLIQKFLEQTDQAGRDSVMKEIYQNVADQVPSTWRDKWNAWRYLAMLGNPRTHIRNIVGNVGFQPIRIIKNEVAAGIESALSSAGLNIERTKSFGTSPALYRAAWNDYSNVKDVLSGSKYNDAKSEVQNRRRIFKNPFLETARTKNSAALEIEDVIFKRITYADSLAGYLKANGVTAEQLSNGTVDSKLLSRARDYAGQEALKATYQDKNAFSNRVVNFVNSLGTVGEAVVPFKRTPANILARAVEYSPVGVAKSIYDGLRNVKNGNKTASEVIDEASAGLTGSGLLALGAYMFASGLVTGAQGDDKDDKWAALLGHQGYALELPDGTSVTLDWLAPESLPFFMGVELMSSMGENGMDAESIWNAVKSTANPMLELSMLQGVNDLIDSVQYAEDAPLTAMIPSVIISYFSQAIPTLGGQIERSAEGERMTTYTDKNSSIPSDVQYAIGRASSRIPGWDYQQIPYIDAWGRTESNGDPLVNAANNFLNPAYTSQVDVDEVEAELQKVRDATGDTAVFPTNAQRYIEVNGERKDLTADEYMRYARKLGSERYNLLSSAIKTSDYRSMSSQEKAEYISKLYSYAGAVAKADVSDYELDGWMENAKSSFQDLGISPSSYIALYQKYGSSIMSGQGYEKTKQAVQSGISVDDYVSMKSSLDADGNDSVSQSEAKAALDSQGFTTSQKADLWNIINKSWKNNPYK